MQSLRTKFKAGNYYKPVTLEFDGNRIYINFRYNKYLINEIKESMSRPKYHGFDDVKPRKIWSVENDLRTQFIIQRLENKNPYARYDEELPDDLETNRPLYKHQKKMVVHGLNRHYVVWACEMGTGKTLSMIELMEKAKVRNPLAWYVGPKSGVKAVNMELEKWGALVLPRMFTYEGLVKELEEWIDGTPAPRVVVFDESSKLKNPTSKRSQAALHLANSVREQWGDNGYTILMSGTPAPKSPVDWWHQCEVACPGFLREGNIHTFKKRLCIVEERQSVTGGVYPHIVTWLDDENKCNKCGMDKEDNIHGPACDVFGENETHEFVPSVNEIAKLYRRMSGLVLVQFKKDCLDLPEKQYKVIKIKPTIEMIRASKLIVAKSARAITALSLLRELSDGFQYEEVRDGEQVCPECKGKKTVIIPIPIEEQDPFSEPVEISEDRFEEQEHTCPHCGGIGKTPIFKRSTAVIGENPKDKQLIQDLEDHEDVGRLVVWAGFTGTIDHIVEVCKSRGWNVLRIDGRGYTGFDPYGSPINSQDLLYAMDGSHPKKQHYYDLYGKVVVVANPEAGGMALTLNASPTEIFYSNSFKGEARMQAEDRGHRPGMDTNRGLTIVDYICLPTDQLVLDNLKKKKKLQDLTLGELNTYVKVDHEEER